MATSTTFRPLARLGTREQSLAVNTRSFADAGPYTYQNCQWKIDWQWALALGGPLGLLLLVIATYRDTPEHP